MTHNTLRYFCMAHLFRPFSFIEMVVDLYFTQVSFLVVIEWVPLLLNVWLWIFAIFLCWSYSSVLNLRSKLESEIEYVSSFFIFLFFKCFKLYSLWVYKYTDESPDGERLPPTMDYRNTRGYLCLWMTYENLHRYFSFNP